ncbi:MAG: hypothetical protein ACXVCY_02295 [Pseudobdellovibrionaceae bacterium]
MKNSQITKKLSWWLPTLVLILSGLSSLANAGDYGRTVAYVKALVSDQPSTALELLRQGDVQIRPNDNLMDWVRIGGVPYTSKYFRHSHFVTPFALSLATKNFDLVKYNLMEMANVPSGINFRKIDSGKTENRTGRLVLLAVPLAIDGILCASTSSILCIPVSGNTLQSKQEKWLELDEILEMYNYQPEDPIVDLLRTYGLI